VRKAAAFVVVACSLVVAVSVHARAAPRYLPYTVTLQGTQTTTWSVRGTRTWCAGSGLKVAFDGSGKQVLTFRLPAVTAVGIAGNGLADLDGALTVHGSRSGSASLHYAAVTDRPAACAPPPAADVSVDTSQCGALAFSLPVGIRLAGTKPLLLTGSKRDAAPDCPWLVGAIDDDASWSSPQGISKHQEAVNGLIALDASPLAAPGSGRAHGSAAWNVAVPGGMLTVSTSTNVTARSRLVPTVVSGVSIAGVRYGETYAALVRQARPYGGLSLPDSGFDRNGRTTWQAIDVRVPLKYPRLGYDRISVDVVAPTRGPHGPGTVVSHPPPPDARVTYMQTRSSLEVTSDGIGGGSTLADLKRAGRGKVWVVHGQFGSTIQWYIDGPGSRRTAFSLYKNIVQGIQIGCSNRDKFIVVAVDEFGRC
jgi:hypothetical protein